MGDVLEQKLAEALADNRLLSQKLLETEKLLGESNEQIENLSQLLENEKLYAAELCNKIIELSNELASQSVTEEDDFCNKEYEENIKELERNTTGGESLTPICDLMLSCTLCGEKIKLEELEPHSTVCSSNSASGKTMHNGKDPGTPTLPGMMVATVTLSSKQESNTIPNDTSFKIICKTTISEYKKSLLVAERTKEDFLWFRNALVQFHPHLIIPPFSVKSNVNGNLREAQRFLSRVCIHDFLKSSSLTRKFFDASPEEMEKMKTNFERKSSSRLMPAKPSVEHVDKDGMLFRTQTYVALLIHNLQSLTRHFSHNQEKTSDKQPSEQLSKCFLALSYGESNETYLQTTCQALSSILGSLEKKQDGVYDESVLIEDLESITDYVRAADELLVRVSSSINTYLHWEEQMHVFEQKKSEGVVTPENEKSITQLWAEASANYQMAKEQLERLCTRLSDELVAFDRRKEMEIKQVLIEYAESQGDVYKTMQSKWFGIKLMLNCDINPDIRGITITNPNQTKQTE